MRKILSIVLLVALLFSVSSGVASSRYSVSNYELSLDVSLQTHDMWHGIDTLDNTLSASGALRIDVGDTGIYAGFKYLMPLSGGNAYDQYSISDSTRTEYTIGYQDNIRDGDVYQVDYDVSYTYYDWRTRSYQGNRVYTNADADVQELRLSTQMPNLISNFLPIENLTPKYNISYLFQPGGSSLGIYGFLHEVGLDYDFAIQDQELTASYVIVYDDGALAVHDWTRMVAGLSTSFDIAGGSLSPGIYYQHTFRDGATSDIFMDDTFYGVVTYTIEF